MKFSTILAGFTTVILSACGGGGGGETSSTPNAQPLAKYAGVLKGACSFHRIETATMTLLPDGSLNVVAKSDFYDLANCTGAIVGTMTQSAPINIAYVNTRDATVTLPPATTATSVKVDQISASIPQNSTTVTGTGVTRSVVNGVAQWCIAYGTNGEKTCIVDDGVHQAQTSPGGMYINGNNVYLLSESGPSSYKVDEQYTKQ